MPPVLLGVHVGGAIDDPFFDPKDAAPGVRTPCNNSAFTRRLFDAFADNLCDIDSRDEGPGIWNGVLGGGKDSTGSSDWERIRGVALSVPHVISCLTASGPNSEGVGEGILGTSENLVDFGRSVEKLSDEAPLQEKNF